VIGRYLDPPAGAVVLSLDEKTQVQALNRTQPLLPVDFGLTEKRTHDHKRHGTTNLFAALDVGTGQVLADCYPRRTGVEFLALLRKAVRPHRGKEIHVVLDNLSTHDTPDVQAWLARNPTVTFHFTPVGSSCKNQVETFFGIITKQAIRRGTFTSVNALISRIRAYVQNWNTDARPFVWTATADEILAKVRWVESNVKKLASHADRASVVRLRLVAGPPH
jgi:transposase